MNRRYTIYVSDNTTHTRQEGWYCGTELLGSSKYALKFDSIKAAEGKIASLGYEHSSMSAPGRVTAYVACAL